MAYTYSPYMTTPYLWPYYQQPFITPLIPAQLSLPASPNAGAGTRRVRFEGENDDNYYTGRRPPSWHGGAAPPPNPAPFPSPPFVYTTLPPTMPYGTPQTHHRRYSDGAVPQPTWVQPTWMMYAPAPAPPPPSTFNPLINGEIPGGPLLLFDLSSNVFSPRRISNHGSTYGLPLQHDEFTQTATYPSVTRMVITCDEIPEWQVVLEPGYDRDERPSNNGYLGVPPASQITNPPPITVHDVLFAIHRMLQRQVTQREWYDLPRERSTAVARAYTRRCKAVPTTQAFEESQGVRRVDFLQDKCMFKGLVHSRGEQGFENVRMRVGNR